MQFNAATAILIVVLAVVAIAILWFVLSKLYQRSSTELSFVRTGFLGRKVVISGGALVIPVLHEVVRIGMNTHRLPVKREREQSLITKDRIRVDVEADFYVRVEPDSKSVAAAAQTLGRKTISDAALLDLVEAKFVDALRAVAAETSLEELHEQRHVFAERVRALVQKSLEMNGLGVETVSINRLDQTSREFFNPNNSFDAAGLTWLTQVIEERRKRRNEIEREAQVAIQRKNLAVEQQMLELGRDEEYARLSQEREIAISRARKSAEVAVEEAQRRREAEEAQIRATEAVDRAKLLAEKAVKEERMAVERALREIDVQRSRAVEEAEIDKRKAIELAEQVREIEIATHAIGVEDAKRDAERARAAFVRAEESVISARDVERAERARLVQVSAARAEAERIAIGETTAAIAQKETAEHRAEAIRISTEADANAARVKLQLDEQRYAVDAAGRRSLYEAENAQTPETMALRVKLELIEQLQGIIRESGKPLEKIEGIKIVQLSGADGAGGGAHGAGAEDSLSDQVVSSALKYRTQAPFINALLTEVGLSAAGPGDLLRFVNKQS